MITTFRTILLSLFFVVSFATSAMEVEVSAIPDFHDFLKEQALEGSWGVFIPKMPAPKSKDHLNIQFSFKNGKIGLDWVLLSPVNIRDRALFETFAKKNAFEFNLITASNGIKYLRSEQEGINHFCGKTLIELYGLTPDEKIDFYSGGYGE